DGCARARREVVQDAALVALSGKQFYEVGADEAGPSRHEDLHALPLPSRPESAVATRPRRGWPARRSQVRPCDRSDLSVLLAPTTSRTASANATLSTASPELSSGGPAFTVVFEPGSEYSRSSADATIAAPLSPRRDTTRRSPPSGSSRST